MSVNNNGDDWQISKSKIASRGEYLLETGRWSDCRFIVGVEPHQEIIDGHKLFLAMSSPVFEAMFFGPLAEKNEQPIPILDVQPKAFKALLQYIYTDKIQLNSFDQACELCYGGKKYMLPHLVVECTSYLWSDLNPKNVCRAYEFAKLFEEPNLMEKCLQIICSQTQEVLSETSFEEVELNTLITIYSQENLSVDSELDLFNALVKYTKKHGEEVQSVSGVAATSESVPPVDTSPTIRDVLKHIRFLTMTPQQFADGPALSDLLTKSEKFEILMNMSSDMGSTPMPEGFSLSKKQRKESNGPFIIFSSGSQSTRPPEIIENIFGMDSNNSGNPIFMRERAFSDIENIWVPTSREEEVEEYVHDENSMRNMPKYYCTRQIVQKTECLSRSVFDCAVTFSVDRNICILGIEVAAQVLQHNGTYSELLYAHLVDSDGSRLTYLHYTARVQYRSIIELMFYRPVYIQRNKDYKVVVVFNRHGWYPFGTSPPSAVVRGVNFSFNDESRDNLIRSIIFSY